MKNRFWNGDGDAVVGCEVQSIHLGEANDDLPGILGIIAACALQPQHTIQVICVSDLNERQERSINHPSKPVSGLTGSIKRLGSGLAALVDI